MSSVTDHLCFWRRWTRRNDKAQTTQSAGADGTLSAQPTLEGEADGTQEPAARQVAARRTSQREKSLAQLHQAYEEVVGLVGNLTTHMEQQSHRSERLLTMMEGLPEALKSLPEANRNQTQVLQVIQGHIERQSQQSEGLTQAIQGLSQATGDHGRAMNDMQRQLDAGQERQDQLNDSFTALGRTLDQMGQSSHASTQVLQRLASRHDQAETQMHDLFRRNQRQTTAMSAVSWSLAVVALAVAGSMVMWVNKQTAGAPAQTTLAAGVLPEPASTAEESQPMTDEGQVAQSPSAEPASDVALEAEADAGTEAALDAPAAEQAAESADADADQAAAAEAMPGFSPEVMGLMFGEQALQVGWQAELTRDIWTAIDSARDAELEAAQAEADGRQARR